MIIAVVNMLTRQPDGGCISLKLYELDVSMRRWPQSCKLIAVCEIQRDGSSIFFKPFRLARLILSLDACGTRPPTKRTLIQEATARQLLSAQCAQSLIQLTSPVLACTTLIQRVHPPLAVREENLSRSPNRVMFQENRNTIVKAVLDPISGRTLSVEEAIKRQLLDFDNLLFHNNKTGERMSFTEAIMSGFIVAQEEVRSCRTALEDTVAIRETRSFHVCGAVEPETGLKLDLDTAVERGVLRPRDGLYCMGLEPHERMPISEAIQRGLVLVQNQSSFVARPADRNRKEEEDDEKEDTGLNQLHLPLPPVREGCSEEHAFRKDRAHGNRCCAASFDWRAGKLESG